MNRDFEAELRDRLAGASLPAAPDGLQERVRSVVSQPQSGPSTAAIGSRGRLLVSLAAVLVIAVAAVLAAGGRSPNQKPNSGSQGPSVATFVIESRVGEWCSPFGCEFHVELAGQGGPWRGQLDYAELGDPTGITPRLPAFLSPGSYSLQAEIHVFGDAIYPGESGPRDLGTTATCSSKFTVTPETRAVVATVGFWLDRCSVGTVAAADPGALTALELESTIEGDCGDFGCDYRVTLSGLGGSWQTVLMSQKLADQLVIGPGLPPTLEPGSYRLEASSHLMSDEPFPGVGHQQELEVAGTCSAQFDVGPETGRSEVVVRFDGIACAVETVTVARPDPTPPVDPAPTPSPTISTEIVCDDYVPPSGLGLVLDCATAIDAALAALGSDHPSIARMEFVHTCWSNDGSIVDCTIQLMGIVWVTYVDQAQLVSVGVSGYGANATGEVLEPRGPPDSTGMICAELEPPALTCAEIRTATLEALGPDHPPIRWLEVSRLCLLVGGVPCNPGGSVLVKVTFDTPDGGRVSFIVSPSPDGPTAGILGVDPGPTEQPSKSGGPRDSREKSFGPEYPAEAPVGWGLRIEKVKLSEDRRTLTVTFYGGGCWSDEVPWVGRDGDQLLVSIVEVDRPHATLPSGVGCVLVAYRYTFHLALSGPFLGSTVRDLNGGVLVLE